MTLEEDYEKYLKSKGVRLPNKNTILYNTLHQLHKKMGRFCKRTTIAKEINYSNGDMQQLKELKKLGWNVKTDGRGKNFGATLINLDVHQDYNASSKLDKIKDWQDLKSKRNFRCFTCGSKESEPIWGAASKICKLQKGHQDPNKPLTDDNCIPQCQQCNQPSQDRFIFNKWGRAIKANNKEKQCQQNQNQE